MALKATIVKADLQISDLDRGYYASHGLTLAQHPSETETRLMVRVLAFALFAHERLEFGRGLSTDEDPDLWRREYDGDIALWIELGQPEESRLRKAAGRAREVVVLNYGGRASDLWWEKQSAGLARLRNLTVLDLPGEEADALAAWHARGVRWNVLIQDGEVQIIDEAGNTLALHPRSRQQSASLAA